jgi:hypothetical protein
MWITLLFLHPMEMRLEHVDHMTCSSLISIVDRASKWCSSGAQILRLLCQHQITLRQRKNAFSCYHILPEVAHTTFFFFLSLNLYSANACNFGTGAVTYILRSMLGRVWYYRGQI